MYERQSPKTGKCTWFWKLQHQSKGNGQVGSINEQQRQLRRQAALYKCAANAAELRLVSVQPFADFQRRCSSCIALQKCEWQSKEALQMDIPPDAAALVQTLVCSIRNQQGQVQGQAVRHQDAATCCCNMLLHWEGAVGSCSISIAFSALHLSWTQEEK